MNEPQQIKTMDGNTAAATAAYAFTEAAAIYPITPSSVMADVTDKNSVSGKKNIFGEEVQVVEMQSEAGAAGAVHGALSAGALATTFTSSQGLLLMIPNMYKMAGELLPGVIHVAARTVAAHALSIFGDHSDIYACRQTGYAMLASNNPQEAFDLGCIAHLSAIESRIPFLHFFDGFRTSHEIQKVKLIDYENLEKMVNKNRLQEFRNRALNPNSPLTAGTAQNDDVYFQNREACNIFYEKIPENVENYMNKINSISGTTYKLFNYYGAPDAEKIIIAMGSVCETIEETIDYLTNQGEKVGLIKVHLYRPFSVKHLLKSLPLSTKIISVLDRTKEPGSIGEPLYLDVVAALKGTNFGDLEILSGRYGLSSKNTTPEQIIAVYDNMSSKNKKFKFTIGINDDVTNLSLKVKEKVNTLPKGTFSCKFWGIGSDGTISAAKNTIKIIGNNTQKHVQGFFQYDSKKSGGLTISHLRFGDSPIKSTYYVDKADFVACHTQEYIHKYDIINDLKPGGSFLLNCSWNEEEIDKFLPSKIKKYIAENNINFYVIDAANISRNLGLGGRVNTTLQSAFFKITNIMDEKKALDLIKEAIIKTYSKKGESIVKLNHNAADAGVKYLKKINIPKSWNKITDDTNFSENKTIKNSELKKFFENIADPITKLHGNDLPVSKFLEYSDGKIPLGTASLEKRGTASFIPEWIPENCIQCGFCSLVCPHAVIRPSVLDEEETKNAPKNLKFKKMLGFQNLNFSINISAKDCTGCENCVAACPGMKGKKALSMVPINYNSQKSFEYCEEIPEKSEIFEKFKRETIKGSQFKKPLLEFSGACAGCGETPYAKLATQLFGERMIIANATGCSSIWGGSFPSTPYTTNQDRKGPAWQNSLFEDNAEFGYGIFLSEKIKRKKMGKIVNSIKNSTQNAELKNICEKYLETQNNSSENYTFTNKLISYLENNKKNIDIDKKLVSTILDNVHDMNTKSVWIFGGDGWAYDIGFGGLDHIIASGENVNILVFDTEVYSNTGGQASKSTPKGAIAQFASGGKKTPKKNLAAIAMTYGYVYVAQVALGADYTHCVKAFEEAESYEGPSIIIAYSPCINHGIKGGMKNSLLSSKQAVDSGYWKLFKFNPEKETPYEEILNKKNIPIEEFLETETRFNNKNK
ncbi:MAG: pyruvate:ferredoxin (flavodoxin) oxidoreductase [Acutalibacteraceae bacterium]